MNGQDALKAAIAASGKTAYSLSKDVGRSPSYVSQMLRQASKPTGETLALIGNACGYRLALVPMGEDLPAGSLEVTAP